MATIGIFHHLQTDSIVMSNGITLHAIASVTKSGDATSLPENSIFVDAMANMGVVRKNRLRHFVTKKQAAPQPVQPARSVIRTPAMYLPAFRISQ